MSLDSYGCYNNPRIMGGGGSRKNHFSEMGPIRKMNSLIIKFCHTGVTLKILLRQVIRKT